MVGALDNAQADAWEVKVIALFPGYKKDLL